MIRLRLQLHEEFKELTFKHKLQYIWDYYSGPFFITVIVLATVCAFTYNAVAHREKKIYSGVTFFGDYIQDDKTQLLRTTLTDRFATDKKYDVKVYNFYSSDTDPTVEVAMGEKFFAMYAGKQIDLLVFDEFYMPYLVEVGYLVNLDSFLDKNLLAHYGKDGALFYSHTKEYPENMPYAISLKNTTYLKNAIGFDTSKKYVGFARSSVRTEEARKLLALLMS